jgi:long-chain acyl-CoA synthetase
VFIGTHARSDPARAAVVMTHSGYTLTYAELDAQSSRTARWLLERGVGRGRRIAVLMENTPEFLVVAWAAFRSGLDLVAVNRHATADDLAYIIEDSSAQALFCSGGTLPVAQGMPGPLAARTLRIAAGATAPGWVPFDEVIGHARPMSADDEWMGHTLFYTSGTTGRPKGVLRIEPPMRADATWPRAADLGARYGFGPDTVYLSPAPLYHGAPLMYTRAVQCLGGTVVVMEKFDAADALRTIERHRVTHSQWVPTMFVRMLRLPEQERARHDLSSHRVAIHAAAPCPIEVKRAMIDWWGPIVHEYYGATDAAGGVFIDPEQWLRHPGAVGEAPRSRVRICDDTGAELEDGRVGSIYVISPGPPPAYLNDPEKTRAGRHPMHPDWWTVGDLGYVRDGFLYLTDRKSYTIISGGVNIYPQAIEDALVGHPAVMDAAVFGVPDEDLGEVVKAVIEPVAGHAPSDALATALTDWCRARLPRYMVPKSIDFVEQLPRTPAGKLLKGPLRNAYRARGMAT